MRLESIAESVNQIATPIPEGQSQVLPPKLLRDLHEGSREERLLAVAGLRSYGSGAVEPLCQALSVKDPEVAAAAAEALAETGDQRALVPLVRALKRHSLTRASRARWVVRLESPLMILAALGGTMLVWQHTGSVELCVAGVLTYVLAGVMGMVDSKRPTRARVRQQVLLASLVRALQSISLRYPAAEASAVIEDLRALAASQAAQPWIGAENQHAAGEAANLISGAASIRRDLPLPSEGPSVSTLPRAAALVEPDGQTLPRVDLDDSSNAS